MVKYSLAVLALVIFAFVSVGTARAYDRDKKYPIDEEFEKMIDEDPSTSGMIAAANYAEKAWDKLLNENYQALMKKLDKKQQERFKASQREWIKYRDLEFAFNGEFWAGFDGTMYRTFSPDYRAEFVKNRALTLGDYIESLDEM
jgi:uncharacterized protein YecT (DUF1311 family)